MSVPVDYFLYSGRSEHRDGDPPEVISSDTGVRRYCITYRGADRVTVLGLVCEKMSERLVLARQEEEDRRVRQEVSRSPQEESVDGQGMVDDDGFPDDREVWEVTHVREEDLETNEGEGVDFLAELLEMAGWGQVDDEETEEDFP